MAATISIYFTMKPILYKESGSLNPDTSVTIIEFSGSQMNTENQANYRFKFRISVAYLHVHIFRPDNSSESHTLAAYRTPDLDVSGEISKMVVESDTYAVGFSFTLYKVNYEIDWIYGVLASTYLVFFAIMAILLRRYNKDKPSIDNVLKSMEQDKSVSGIQRIRTAFIRKR